MTSRFRIGLVLSLVVVVASGLALVGGFGDGEADSVAPDLAAGMAGYVSPGDALGTNVAENGSSGASGVAVRNSKVPPGQDKVPPGQAKKQAVEDNEPVAEPEAVAAVVQPPPPPTTAAPTPATAAPTPATAAPTPATAAPTPTTAAPTPTTAAPAPTTTSAPSTTVPSGSGGSLSGSVSVRGFYGDDSSATGWDAFKSVGFNAVTVSASRSALDALQAAGMKGVVWLGEYDRTSACNFEFTDDQIRSMVGAIAGHPAIAAYILSDEPTYARADGCSSAVSDHRTRSDLVHSLDPANPTMVTLTTWDGVESYPYRYWAGAADIFGLVVYPCYQGSCKFDMVDTAIAQAASAGLGEIWPIVQDFSDSWYDFPTADQVNEQFARWSRSGMTGYLVFAGQGFSCCRASDFESNGAKWSVFEYWNRS